MKYQYLAIALLVALAVLAAGCTGGGTTNATTKATTAASTTAPATTVVTTAAPATLQTLPAGLGLAVSVNRQPYNRDIDVTFNGGAGQGSVTAMEVTVVRSDGTTETKPLASRSGSEVTIKGSSGTDTVSVKATLTNGNTYRFFEQRSPEPPLTPLFRRASGGGRPPRRARPRRVRAGRTAPQRRARPRPRASARCSRR